MNPDKQRIELDGLSIQFLKQTQPTFVSGIHVHDEYEICYFFAGQRVFFIGDRTYYVNQGQILLISPNQVHRAIPSPHPGYQRFLVYLDKPSMMALPCPSSIINNCFQHQSPVVTLSKKEQLFMETIFTGIMTEAQQKQMGYLPYIHNSFAQIFITLSRIRKQQDATNSELKSQASDTMQEIIQYINDNYMIDITLPLLQDTFNISKSHLTRSFRRVTGFSLVEYINTIRIKEARALLRTSTCSISQIASQVGFSSLTHFERVFKKATDETPTAYRTRNVTTP